MGLLVVLLLLVVAIPFLALFWYAFDDMFGGEDYATSQNTIKRISEAIVAHHSENGLLYDLGSSRGGFILGLLDKNPGLRAVGVDNSLLRVWIARLRGLTGNRAKFVRGNIFDTDISKADIVYAYLPRPMLPALAEKLKRELKPGAIVITSRVYFPDWQPSEVFPKNPADKNEEDVFVYRP